EKFSRNLSFFFHLNHTYGGMFLANILVFCPTNACLSMYIIRGDVVYFNSIAIIGFFLFYQGMTIFIEHLCLTMVSAHIHQPSKVLIHILVHNMSDRKLAGSPRLRLANSIFGLHTKNRYGFTYGKFGL